MGKRTLCLGTGEFMYIPMKIAAEMGENILYQSTTRSPIHPVSNDVNYAIHNHFSYPSPEDPTITNYFYNISPHDYDEAFVFIERDLGKKPYLLFYSSYKQLFLLFISSHFQIA